MTVATDPVEKSLQSNDRLATPGKICRSDRQPAINTGTKKLVVEFLYTILASAEQNKSQPRTSLAFEPPCGKTRFGKIFHPNGSSPSLQIPKAQRVGLNTKSAACHSTHLAV